MLAVAAQGDEVESVHRVATAIMGWPAGQSKTRRMHGRDSVTGAARNGVPGVGWVMNASPS